jgi:hypothetical protein
MKWTEIREKYPEKWLLIEALIARQIQVTMFGCGVGRFEGWEVDQHLVEKAKWEMTGLKLEH